jgi:guanylate kinase
MRAAMPGDVVGVFLLPPSRAALEQRLRLRGQDSEAEIARRMATTQSEMEHYAEFDYAVVNERFDEALMDLRSVLRAARLTTARQTGLPQFTRMALA